MTKESPDFWRSVQDYTTRSIDEQARLWKGYANIWKPVVQGSGEGSSSQSTPVDAVRALGERTARFVRDYTTLTTRYYQGVFDLGRSYAEAIAGQLLGVRASAPAAVSAAAGSIVLEAASGEVAVSSFIVENRRSERMDVDLRVSSFTGPSGTFDAELAIEPARFQLEANEERRVTLRLAMKPEQFAVAGRYTATLVNRGDPDTRLVVEARTIEVMTGRDAAAGR